MFQRLAPFRRPPGGPPDRPGGWWFAVEALVAIAGDEVRRPDVAGWRRERLREMPAEAPVRVVPDWVCEVLSPSSASNDTVEKMTLHVLGARRGERVRAEPFEALELPLSALFGDDE